MRSDLPSNFAHLKLHDEQLVRLGMLAERYFAEDPNTCLLKLRQLTELLAQLTASKVGSYASREEAQFDLLRRLRDQRIVPPEIYQLFDQVRRAGNDANHALAGDHRLALSTLRISWQLGVWFQRTFGSPQFKSGPFLPPSPPRDESEELRAELARANAALAEYQAKHATATESLEAIETKLRETSEERSFWEQMAVEADQAKVALEKKLSAQQAEATEQPISHMSAMLAAAETAAQAVELDEADTRKLIDAQLALAGWVVNSSELTYRKGARPEKGKNMAIAEWPTDSGPADYVLFAGLMPIGVIEAKRKNIDVSAALQQAKRYARAFKPLPELAENGAPWGEFKLPFLFSSNGRPYLQQLRTRSGIWFCDARRPDNLGDPLPAWHSPEGLTELLKRDEAKAHERLKQSGFNFGFELRGYQQEAILAAEAAIEAGQRALLLAMATGTGKTKTCIALIYRLLKAQRFRRVLFLVDRSALGEQAANAFKDTRMESLQTFADTFGIKEIDEAAPESATAVHIATVQGMVKRVLDPSEDSAPPTVDTYDCIIVDECHRGYLLDRELSDTELGFRGFDDYVSKYRRVLDYFDAVKVGLTATPALHTTQIFGLPVFNYSYREAVIDGYLVDHEPPIQIKTSLSQHGIVWQAGAKVERYHTRRNERDLFTTPDEIKIEVEDFNRKVITEAFNRTVCAFLATELDPSSRQKTLIFCVNDAHADMVVDLLKRAFQVQYGSVDDDAVIKITGAADKPLQLIRRYKHERMPSVAVTVDLLTTGVDVPEICNLVFLRRVNSRILFDQMLGRATRLCDEIDKNAFRIFDAVRIYEALEDVTAMQPVVVNPKLTFTQLGRELAEVESDNQRALVRDQYVAKLQRKRHHLSAGQAEDFETRAGMDPQAFIRALRGMTLPDIAAWFTANPDLGEILDRKGQGRSVPVLISNHEDSLVSAEQGYGASQKPEDYLSAFASFVRSQGNTLPALVAVLTRPRELTRKQLRELALELDRAGFTEARLVSAWRHMTNQDIAARIVGFVRQAALGDPLVPYAERVDKALRKLLASRKWSAPQREWLERIAKQTKTTLVVDRDALDDPDQVFKREGGGFARLDKMFSGELLQVLASFNDSLWSGDTRDAG